MYNKTIHIDPHGTYNYTCTTHVEGIESKSTNASLQLWRWAKQELLLHSLAAWGSQYRAPGLAALFGRRRGPPLFGRHMSFDRKNSKWEEVEKAMILFTSRIIIGHTSIELQQIIYKLCLLSSFPNPEVQLIFDFSEEPGHLWDVGVPSAGIAKAKWDRRQCQGNEAMSYNQHFAQRVMPSCCTCHRSTAMCQLHKSLPRKYFKSTAAEVFCRTSTSLSTLPTYCLNSYFLTPSFYFTWRIEAVCKVWFGSMIQCEKWFSRFG